MRTLFIVLALAACGGDDDKKAVDAAVPPIDSAQIDAPAALTLDCPTYCTNITANCTGANAQYGGMDPANVAAHCMGTCSKMALGAVTDMTGNTLGCRIWHSDKAKTTNMPGTHCVHAGPAGAQVDAAAPGVCGDACTSFCELEIAACGLMGAAGNTTGQYASLQACKDACATFEKTAKYEVNTTNFPSTNPVGVTLACRLYHTTNALVSAAQAATHCQHTGPTPVTGCVAAVQ